MNPYSSHLPALRTILARHPVATVVEFGMGLFSTELFLTHCHRVMSVEMQSEDWYHRMIKLYQPVHTWEPVLSLGARGFADLSYPQDIDLIFVDGHGESRPEVINFAVQRGCGIIVAHDTEARGYGWERVRAPGYDRHNFGLSPDVSMWTLRQVRIP